MRNHHGHRRHRAGYQRLIIAKITATSGWPLFFAEMYRGVEPIKMQQSGGLLLQPVQTLVVTIIFAYGENANVIRYERTLTLNRKEKTITLKDEYALSGVVEGITLPLISIEKPVLKRGKIIIPAKDSALEITFDETCFIPVTEKHDMSDEKLQASWKTDMAFRTLLKQIRPEKEGSFEITMKEVRK